MQGYTNSGRERIPVLKILVILFIAYLPVSTFIFFLKNDAFNGYFPPKFFMSESLHAGYLPLWNPYINFGIPQYGDMSSGFWSPITWLIASTIGYNAYTFTAEVLLYILIGGLGMYKLSGYWVTNKNIRLISAVAFMCCGYHIGHLQHFNWISGSAFLPWCAWAYLVFQERSGLRELLITVLAFYMFISSAHPGLIIAAIYFFLALSVFLYINKEKNGFGERIKQYLLSHISLVAVLMLLSAGLILAYTDILPYFSRGEKVAIASSLREPTTFQSWLSALLPFSITKNYVFFATDISMRNIYFGIVPFIFLIGSLFNKKTNWQKFFLITGLAFLLLSTGGIIKEVAYKILPLIGYVRLNGEFVIFSILCFIIVAAIELNKYFNKDVTSKIIQRIILVTRILLAGIILFGIFKAYSTHQSFLFAFKNILSQQGVSHKLKAFIDSLSFYDTLWIQGAIQFLLVLGISHSVGNKRWKILQTIAIADMVIASLLNIPFTGVGQASVAQVQKVLNQSPHGIPIPKLQRINNNDTISYSDRALVGNWSLYNKQPGTSHEVEYPIRLKNSQHYFDTIQSARSLSLMNKAYVYNTLQNKKLSVSSFTPNTVKINLENDNADTIVYQQNYYPHWYYYDIGKKEKVLPYSICFMSAPVANGKQLTFSFEPACIKAGMLISLLAFCAILALLSIKKKSV